MIPNLSRLCVQTPFVCILPVCKLPVCLCTWKKNWEIFVLVGCVLMHLWTMDKNQDQLCTKKTFFKTLKKTKSKKKLNKKQKSIQKSKLPQLCTKKKYKSTVATVPQLGVVGGRGQTRYGQYDPFHQSFIIHVPMPQPFHDLNCMTFSSEQNR